MHSLVRNSRTRTKLFAGLEGFIRLAGDSPRTRSLLIDGSFLTHELSPRDIDVVICYDGTELEADVGFITVLGVSQREILGRFGCDAYLLAEYPEGDTREWQSSALREYWLSEFGQSRAGRLKGIAEIILR